MKFLATYLPDLKLRLLDRIVQARPSSNVSAARSQEKIDAHKRIVCQAVEDRICKRMDLAARTDLTLPQALDALRLLLKIASRNGLPVDFSSAELCLLTRGFQLRSREDTTPTLRRRH